MKRRWKKTEYRQTLSHALTHSDNEFQCCSCSKKFVQHKFKTTNKNCWIFLQVFYFFTDVFFKYLKWPGKCLFKNNLRIKSVFFNFSILFPIEFVERGCTVSLAGLIRVCVCSDFLPSDLALSPLNWFRHGWPSVGVVVISLSRCRMYQSLSSINENIMKKSSKP